MEREIFVQILVIVYTIESVGNDALHRSFALLAIYTITFYLLL